MNYLMYFCEGVMWPFRLLALAFYGVGYVIEWAALFVTEETAGRLWQKMHRDYCAGKRKNPAP